MSRRKICVVTGSRAEYGLLRYLMEEIKEDCELELQLLVTGMHLSPEFGLTYRVIEEDGFTISAKVEMLLSSDTPAGLTKSLGLGVIGCADALQSLQPDLLVVLGDRYEILAVCLAALAARIPVAHLCGGEKTEGAIDEAMRHCITKLSHLHFVSAEAYRQRVIQLGERPETVFNFGNTGLDVIGRTRLLSLPELEETLEFSLGERYFLLTYHPVTLGQEDPSAAMEAIFHALDSFAGFKVLITKPNSDAGGRIICQLLEEYARLQPERVLLVTSLGQLRYLSAMKYCSAVIGNSSSGIVEAPALHKATVNIGVRQAGRLKASSIIDCGGSCQEITAALDRALSPAFQETLPGVRSLYGEGAASHRIKECLKRYDLAGITVKRFHDIELPGHGIPAPTAALPAGGRGGEGAR